MFSDHSAINLEINKMITRHVALRSWYTSLFLRKIHEPSSSLVTKLEIKPESPSPSFREMKPKKVFFVHNI